MSYRKLVGRGIRIAARTMRFVLSSVNAMVAGIVSDVNAKLRKHVLCLFQYAHFTYTRHAARSSLRLQSFDESTCSIIIAHGRVGYFFTKKNTVFKNVDF